MNSHPGETKVQIVEEMHKTASLTGWYQEHGRHAVFAKGKEVPDIAKTRSLSLPVIAKVLETDLDKFSVTPYLVDDSKYEKIGMQ